MTRRTERDAAQHFSTLTLAAGPLELVLAPALGGSVLRFEHRGTDAVRPIMRSSGSAEAGVLSTGNFPLVPFVNRVRGGRFAFRGCEVEIAPNLAGDASPLHGQGWLAEWNAAQHDAQHAELVYRHDAGEWPWAYEAQQVFRLNPDALEIALSCRNLSGDPMPCGLGHHPYFHCDAGTRFTANVAHAWTIDEQVLPLERVPATGRFGLAARAICGQDLDNGFEGWNGHARIDNEGWPFAIELTAPEAQFLHVYSPREGGTFAAEPVTHRAAALNEPEEHWGEAGLRVLEPGEEMSLKMQIALVSAEG